MSVECHLDFADNSAEARAIVSLSKWEAISIEDAARLLILRGAAQPSKRPVRHAPESERPDTPEALFGVLVNDADVADQIVKLAHERRRAAYD
ncbi:MAG TPA: hypothetical protein VK934_03970 [Fimbriimonas sp.]|nr:hypothetical protein [Fimbriimonas sp.]